MREAESRQALLAEGQAARGGSEVQNAETVSLPQVRRLLDAALRRRPGSGEGAAGQHDA